jgi:hypothetical protein
MQYWARLIGASIGDIFVIRLYGEGVFLIVCFFWGALYASALAKPACFGHTPRILKHLTWSCLLSLFSCILPIRIELLNFPNFVSTTAPSALIFAGFTISSCCFVLALAVWVHLAFGGERSTARENSNGTEIQN